MTGTTTFFQNMYTIVTTDSIVVQLHALKILKHDLFIVCLIILLNASIAEIRDAKLNVGS